MIGGTQSGQTPEVQLPELLAPYREILEATLRPTIWIHTDQSGRGEVGQSRVSGTPDLPSSVTWPKFGDHYLDYLLQINLAELPANSGTPPLPSTGMLWLFEGWNAPDGCQQLTMYVGDEPLIPSELLVESYYSDTVEPHTLRFRAGFDIPHWFSDAQEQLEEQLIAAVSADRSVKPDRTSEEIRADGRDVADEVDTALRSTRSQLAAGAFAKLFGWTGGIGHNIHERAFMWRDHPGLEDPYNGPATVDTNGRSSWRNLLTVDSDDVLGLYIGDAGYTAVLIHEDDLQRQDFSACYVTQESSSPQGETGR